MVHSGSSKSSASTDTKIEVKKLRGSECVQNAKQQYDIAKTENQHIKNHNGGSLHYLHIKKVCSCV